MARRSNLGEDVIQTPPAAELLADVPVAAVRTDARRHKVTHPGQPGERARLASHRDRQRGQLGKSAGDHPGPGIVTDTYVHAQQAPAEHSLYLRRDAVTTPRLEFRLPNESELAKINREGSSRRHVEPVRPCRD